MGRLCEISVAISPFGKFVQALMYRKGQVGEIVGEALLTPKDARRHIRELLAVLDTVEDVMDDEKVEKEVPKYICSWTCAGEDDRNATSYMTGCEDKIVFEDGRAADAWDHKFCRKCGDMVMLHYENGVLMKIEDIIE